MPPRGPSPSTKPACAVLPLRERPLHDIVVRLFPCKDSAAHPTMQQKGLGPGARVIRKGFSTEPESQKPAGPEYTESFEPRLAGVAIDCGLRDWGAFRATVTGSSFMLWKIYDDSLKQRHTRDATQCSPASSITSPFVHAINIISVATEMAQANSEWFNVWTISKMEQV